VNGVGSIGARPELVRVFKPGLDGGTADGRKLFVVGYDPGGKTGWCVMRVHLEHLLSGGLSGVALAHPDPEVFSFRAGYFEGPEPYQAEMMMALLRGTWMHGEGVWDAGEDSDLFVAVIESFHLRMMGGEDLLSPVRVSAMFAQLAWRALYLPVVPQQPSEAKRTITDEVLHKLNLWTGPDGAVGKHQRDATRHAALMVRRMTDRHYLEAMSQRMKWLSE
jgi:hypothetical protein